MAYIIVNENNPTKDSTAVATMAKPVTVDLANWAKQYKEQSIEMHHSDAMFDLVSPDDSILVAGPARLSEAADRVLGAGRFTGDELATAAGVFYVIGACQSLQIQESSQIQPLKALGSRRHLFTKTNIPATASIGRMMFYGRNLARALYMNIEAPKVTINDKYYQGENTEGKGYNASMFLTNLEEDLYRIPFGLGIIYHTPYTASMASYVVGKNMAAGAEYLENCYLQSRSVSMQTGQTMVMEQVQIIADRVVPWDSYLNVGKIAKETPLVAATAL